MTRMPMSNRLAAVAAAAGLAAAALCGCGGSSGGAESSEPATVEPIKGTDVSRVILSADAARRLGIVTADVRARGAHRKVVPYGAVVYSADGSTFTYTSPKPREYVRAPIRVVRIDGPVAILSSGPPAGTAVVTVGSQELYGTEYEVEED